MDAPESKSLPENAYETLAPGATYQPVVPPQATPPEVTRRSLLENVIITAIGGVAGIFAAGDVRASSGKRVAAAVGEGSGTVSMVHRYLETV